MNQIDELISGKGANHVLPFFWMHGEPHRQILEELDKVEACGIREICLEARPHPDFAGEHWWRDLDLIMDECRKRGMRVWVLDDDHFPTGHANGAFKDKYPEKAKWYLGEQHMDLVGPAEGVSVLISPVLPKDARILGILAYPLQDPAAFALNAAGVLDLTDSVQDDFITLDVPAGHFRLFTFFATQTGGGRPGYMNLIDSESVKVLIDEVYEPHYKRYKDDFGKTFAGFFSDEPEFGNSPGYSFDDLPGKPFARLPWSAELEAALKKRWKSDFPANLGALWYDLAGRTVPVRYGYMDEASRLVYTCFSGQLGAWCKERGVEYIGHIIEDNNSHSRLGCSIGHYFREQKGQHIAGIDVVHHQIIPGFTETVHRWVAGDGDGEFFHFGLARLGSSAALIDPEKKGRALCEVYGNYGWVTGIALMKWLADHMLVNGINYFVPHAFCPRFPDVDCPPHFYARGHNPQYRFFAELMKYINRLAQLLEGGKRHPEAAVLYHGDSEWGGAPAMLFQKPVRSLQERQLDCLVIPADIFADGHLAWEGKELCINGTCCRSIVVPACEYLPGEAILGIMEAAKQGVPVFFVERRPCQDMTLKAVPEEFAACGTVVSLENLAGAVEKAAPPPISLSGEFPALRLYSAAKDDAQVLMLFNEHHAEPACFEVRLPPGVYSRLIRYDGTANTAESWKIENNAFPVKLESGEAALYLLDGQGETASMPVSFAPVPIECDWNFFSSPENDGVFTPRDLFKAGHLPNLHRRRDLSDFAGEFRYTGTFEAKKAGGRCLLYLPRISDCAKVKINGAEAGVILGNSGRLDITAHIRDGQNELSIDIATTLVKKMKDPISCYMGTGPLGMTKAPVLEYLLRS